MVKGRLRECVERHRIDQESVESLVVTLKSTSKRVWTSRGYRSGARAIFGAQLSPVKGSPILRIMHILEQLLFWETLQKRFERHFSVEWQHYKFCASSFSESKHKCYITSANCVSAAPRAQSPSLGPIKPHEIAAALPKEGIAIGALMKFFTGRVGDGDGQTAKKDFIKLVKENSSYGPDKLLRPK